MTGLKLPPPQTIPFETVILTVWSLRKRNERKAEELACEQAFSREGNSPLFLSLRYFFTPKEPTARTESLFTGYGGVGGGAISYRVVGLFGQPGNATFG